MLSIISHIVTAIIVVVSLLIQGHSSFDALRIGGVKPDLLFIAIIYFSYTFGSFYGEATAFLGGLIHDAVSNAPLGFLTLPKVIVAFTVGLIGRSVIKSNILTIAMLMFLSSIFKGIITLLLAIVFHEAVIGDIARVIMPESFYNALLAPPLFFLFDRIYENELPAEGSEGRY
ncbi:MAG: rod shape-determining protein MreD [Spirochaetota bacterium]